MLHPHDLSDQVLVAHKHMGTFSIQALVAPEVPPDEEIIAMHINGELRLRRWKNLHFEDAS